MRCNICGCETFLDMRQRKNVACKDCGSLERTRLLWFFFQDLKLPKNAAILHIAPERGIHDAISAIRDVGSYECADFDPSAYKFASCRKIDLCNLDGEPSLHYDLILHSHVMEHVPCNIAYSLYHLHRMLKPDGVHLCIIPFMPGKYDECFQDIGDEERNRRFGQSDHVRRFGKDDVSLHLGKLLRLPERFDATTRFSSENLREANVPESIWSGFHIATVLQLKRDDMVFLRGA